MNLLYIQTNKSLIPALILMLLTLSSCLVNEKVPEGYKTAYEQALSLKEMGDFKGALSTFKSILEKYPTAPTESKRNIQLLMAACEIELENHQGAAKIYRLLLSEEKSDAQRATLLFYLGMSELSLGEFTSAAQSFQKSSLLQEDSVLKADMKYRSGIALQRAGNFAQAKIQFNDIIKSNPDSPTALKSKSRVYLPDYFTVQAGAFSKRQNASITSQKIKEFGFPAMIVQLRGNTKTPYVVYVGKLRSYEHAKLLKARLEALKPLEGKTQYVIRP